MIIRPVYNPAPTKAPSTTAVTTYQVIDNGSIVFIGTYMECYNYIHNTHVINLPYNQSQQ